MEVIIKNYGSCVNTQEKPLKISIGSSVTFDYLDEKIVVTVIDFNSNFYIVSLNREFCLVNYGVINLTDGHRVFNIPYIDKTTIGLPIYDEVYNLEFSAVEEEV